MCSTMYVLPVESMWCATFLAAFPISKSLFDLLTASALRSRKLTFGRFSLTRSKSPLTFHGLLIRAWRLEVCAKCFTGESFAMSGPLMSCVQRLGNPATREKLAQLLPQIPAGAQWPARTSARGAPVLAMRGGSDLFLIAPHWPEFPGLNERRHQCLTNRLKNSMMG